MTETTTTHRVSGSNTQLLRVMMQDSGGDGWNGGKFLVRNYSSLANGAIFIVMKGDTASAWANASYSIRLVNAASAKYNSTITNGGLSQTDEISEAVGQILYLTVEGVTSDMSWDVRDDSDMNLVSSRNFQDPNVQNHRFHVPGVRLWEETLRSGSEGELTFPVMLGDRLSISLIPPFLEGGLDITNFSEMGMAVESEYDGEVLEALTIGTEATLEEKRRVTNQLFPVWRGWPEYRETYRECNKDRDLGYLENYLQGYWDSLDVFSNHPPFSDGPYIYHWAKEQMHVARHAAGDQVLTGLELALPADVEPNFVDAFSTGEYSYLLSSNGTTGVLVRFHEDFISSKVSSLDLSATATDFAAAFSSNGSAFLVPGRNGALLLQIDLNSFQLNSQVDLLSLDADLQDFVTGVAVGDYGLLVPKRNKAVRVDLTSLNVSLVDFSNFGRLRNFESAFKGIKDDVYLVPGRSAMAVKVNVKTLDFQRLDLADIDEEGFKGGAIQRLEETGFFVSAHGTVVRFYVGNFTIVEQFQAVSAFSWDINVQTVFTWGPYDTTWFSKTRDNFLMFGCEQAVAWWVYPPPTTIFTFYAEQMEYVFAILRNSTVGAGNVNVTVVLNNTQGTASGGGAVLTVSDGVQDLTQLTLPDGNQSVEAILTVPSGSLVYVTVLGDVADEMSVDWAVLDEMRLPVMSANDSSIGRWPVGLPVTVPGLWIYSSMLEQGPFQADFWGRVTDSLSWTLIPTSASVNLSAAFWGFYDHQRDPIMLATPRSSADLPQHLPFTLRGGETFIEAYSTTKTTSSTMTTRTETTATTSSTVTSVTNTNTTTMTSSTSSTVSTTSSTISTSTMSSTSSTRSTTSTSTISTTSSTFTTSSSTTTITSSTTITTTSSTRSSTTTSTISQTSTSITSTSSTISSTSSTTSTISSTTSSSTSISSSSTSSTTLSSTSTTSSTTLAGQYIVPDLVDVSTPEGSVVQATLQSALVALNSDQASVVQDTPQGTVTVLKVSPVEVERGLVFQLDDAGTVTEGSSEGASVTVSIPASIAQQAANGLNLMVTLTQVTQEVSREMPYRKGNGDAVQYNSKVLEFSFVQETGGTLEIASIENATEPIHLRFAGSEPIEGDVCAFFDLATSTWSSEGVILVDGSSVPNNSLAGTWCEVSHTSIFAVVQIVPFDLIHDPEAESLNASGATIAGALAFIILCCISVPACCILLRRIKPASAGQTEIRDNKGNKHVVHYVRTEVIEETRTIHDDREDEVEDQKKKVLVKWDVDVAAMMRRLNTLRGHAWVSMDMRARKTDGDTLTMTKEASKSITKRHFARSEASEGSQGGLGVVPSQTQRSDVYGPMDSFDPEEGTIDVSPSNLNDVVPPEHSIHSQAELNDPTAMVQVTVEDLLEVWAEVFEENAPVSYWSATHQRMLQGFIQGRGIFDEEPATSSDAEPASEIQLPCYDVRVGVRHQLRHAVPITHLEPALQVNEAVFVWVEQFRLWKKGTVSNCLHSAGMYQVLVFPEEMQEEMDSGSVEPLVLDHVTLERIRRRYEKNSAVQVYRGKRVGWIHGLIMEDVKLDLKPPPPMMSPRMAATPRAYSRPEDDTASPVDAKDREATTVTVTRLDDLPETIVEVRVRIVGQEEEEAVPSYLVFLLPERMGI